MDMDLGRIQEAVQQVGTRSVPTLLSRPKRWHRLGNDKEAGEGRSRVADLATTSERIESHQVNRAEAMANDG